MGTKGFVENNGFLGISLKINSQGRRLYSLKKGENIVLKNEILTRGRVSIWTNHSLAINNGCGSILFQGTTSMTSAEAAA